MPPELFEAAPPLRRVYVPIGMGSGICGLIRVRDLLGLDCEIVGVVSSAADAYAQSFEQGRIVCTKTADTFADGMACRMPAAEALEIIAEGAARIARVDDGEIRRAIVALHVDTHNTAEAPAPPHWLPPFRNGRLTRGTHCRRAQRRQHRSPCAGGDTGGPRAVFRLTCAMPARQKAAC